MNSSVIGKFAEDTVNSSFIIFAAGSTRFPRCWVRWSSCWRTASPPFRSLRCSSSSWRSPMAARHRVFDLRRRRLAGHSLHGAVGSDHLHAGSRYRGDLLQPGCRRTPWVSGGARNNRVEVILRSVLDFMQTMPAFVYLIPAVIPFGLGRVPATIATVVFAMPPVVRLTTLGIRQIREELPEAGRSFGSTDSQLLWKIQLPNALPSITCSPSYSIARTRQGHPRRSSA